MAPPKQLKLTHSLFAFQQISRQTDGMKRKQMATAVANGCLSPSTSPPQKKHQIVPPPIFADEGNAAEMKENLLNVAQTDSTNGIATETTVEDPPAMSSTPWHLSHTLVEPTWQKLLQAELQTESMNAICCFLEEQYKKGVTVFPPRHLIFNAFNLTPFNTIRVVVIGQDPYHNLGQAHGLSFSVPNGQPLPPSLRNIFKELSTEYADFVVPQNGTLTKWATQGVFLLNASLTVEAHKANSHSRIGWQQFTDTVIRLISANARLGIVFLLWGGFAHKKEALIDAQKHRIIKTAHPSPLSARLFFGCKCFSRTNDALREMGREPIEWTTL